MYETRDKFDTKVEKLEFKIEKLEKRRELDADMICSL